MNSVFFKPGRSNLFVRTSKSRSQRGGVLVTILVWFVAIFDLPASDYSNEDELQSGKLLLVGGGKLPPEIRDLFFQLAGGENARIVLIPTGSQDAESPAFIEDFLEPWQKYSPQSIVVLHARNRCQANDPDFLKPLREATGVWISGGVQARLADRYVGTKVEAELRHLLGRDGIIAGTSAGAAVMTRVMIADGLRQPAIASGLDLFSDAIVDQHFSQRYRMIRLAKATQMNPNRFGVGIDEGTGLLILQNRGRILGQGQVRFIAATQRPVPSATSLMVCDYASGEEVNLKLWREAAAQARPITQAELSRGRRARVMQSRIAPSLTYSLSYEPNALDSCR